MSEAYAGKSDQQIIQEQAASLASKENYQTPEKFNPIGSTALQEDEQSNINESGLDGFPGASVSVGRTGQTGGGTNAQTIPPDEGGLARAQVPGESSDRFEGEGQFGGADEKRAQRLADEPGSYDANPRGVEQSYNRANNEAIPITQGQELQPGQGLDYDQAGQGSKQDL